VCKPHAVDASISDFAGKRVGVDIAGKLVSAALSRSYEFHHGEQVPSHHAAVSTYVRMLVGVFGAACIVLVFDGARFPLKLSVR
jgi:hypothetical protein